MMSSSSSADEGHVGAAVAHWEHSERVRIRITFKSVKPILRAKDWEQSREKTEGKTDSVDEGDGMNGRRLRTKESKLQLPSPDSSRSRTRGWA